MGRQDHILSPLLEDPDPPASKNTPTSPTLSKLEELKSLSERAKACDLDPQLLLLAEIMSKTTTPSTAPPQHSQPAHIRYDFLAKQVGIMQKNEDIFAVLNRFQYNLKLNNVPHAEYLRALPAVLIGQYKEAYYNNVEGCHSYNQMRDILLAVGGYTPNECLNSFPLKYRPGGTKSITQWFHMWSYKFAVILNHIPFLDNMSEAAIDKMSKIFCSNSSSSRTPNGHKRHCV